MFLLMSASRADDGPREGFPPLAVIALSVSEPGDVLLIETIKGFASKEHLNIENGNFLKSDRPVVNMTVRIKKESFFHITNLNYSDEFVLTAHSHDEEKVWKPIWERLIAKLESVFGASRISHQRRRNLGT
jgi:hypothetical protein